MKDIHPTYHRPAVIKCGCGNEISSGSTRPEMSVEICAACHPFYTQTERLVDTQGRVEKFRARQAIAKKEKPAKAKPAKKKTEKKEQA